MKLLFCASEAIPYAKTGGLADVVGSLPEALARQGHDARLLLPRYGWVPRERLQLLPTPVTVALGREITTGALLEDPEAPIPTYFLEHDDYFDRPWIYGPPGEAFRDNCQRFSFLSGGALAACETLDWAPDVLHVHDWHTALAPVLLNARPEGDPLRDVATVLTIHNVGYQGLFPKEELRHTGLGWEHYTHLELEYHDQFNLLKGGIVHSTMVTTVSPTHAEEIQTPRLGFGLDGVLRQRRNELTGILNGIDTTVWDPQTDPAVAAPFGAEDLSGKRICKAELQRRSGLEPRGDVPVLAIVSRLTAQKGIDVVIEAIVPILELGVQLIVLGAGDPQLCSALQKIAQLHHRQCAVTIGYDELVSHRLVAGADFMLVPSRYEPCGLTQLYSQRYGTVPIVRATGGLADSVVDDSTHPGRSTGYAFKELDPAALLRAIGRAVNTYHTAPGRLNEMIRRCMIKDFGWSGSAAQYAGVYQRAVDARSLTRSR
ncbi:MAG: glycogen synthase GlgA [bacterium]